MTSLSDFYYSIQDFTLKPQGKLIHYFVYYLTEIAGGEFATAQEVHQCFIDLDLHPYSNVSAYLSAHSKRNGAFVKSKIKGYRLSANERDVIYKQLGVVKRPAPTNALLPLDSFQNTRQYLEKLVAEINSSYDLGLYTGAMVLLRRLFETLIIEAYEKHAIESRIKNSAGDYFMFSDLLSKYTSEPVFKASRNFKDSSKKIKAMGDACAHNRKFIGQQSHIKPYRDDLVLAVEEMLSTINF